MAAAEKKLAGGLPPVQDDPVLAAMAQAEAQYRAFRADWEGQSAELAQTRESLQSAQGSVQQLTESLSTTQQLLDQERRQSTRQRERADHLSRLLKEIHRSLFTGNVYALILRACLTLTGATRGMYLTVREPDFRVRVRAAVDIDGYPKAPPSDFIKALCRTVVDRGDSFVANDVQELGNLPQPQREGERFHNCLVTPVVLLKDFDGIVIVADKAGGEFDEDDVETLLSVGDQAAVAVENAQLQRDLQNAYLSTVSILADAVEAKDPYTHGHCEQVSRYSRLTAVRLDLTEFQRSVVCYSALLHDVGKIGVSDGVLHKPGALTPEERELVRSHVRVGYDLIRHVPALSTIADVVLHHHEWYNGNGYPDGLAGEAIPIAARIVAVVDAYCAMITRRSYKDAYSDERARDELRRYSGTQFDPQVVDAFLGMLDTPEAQDTDIDDDAECGVLPGFGQLHELQHAMR